MKQHEQVINVMKLNGGYATFGQLNQMLDYSSWKTKTPQASVRRIVQTNEAFFKIQPGLWALKEFRETVLHRLSISQNNKEDCEDKFTHSYYQGLIVKIGNMQGFETFVPNQDKNRLFLEQPLAELSTLENMPDFTYPSITKRAKTIDAVWFNVRKLPSAFFEVEHSTDFTNSLSKYYELQDFATQFVIVAASYRKPQFEDIIARSLFAEIRNRVSFQSYDYVVSVYEKYCSLQATINNYMTN